MRKGLIPLGTLSHGSRAAASPINAAWPCQVGSPGNPAGWAGVKSRLANSPGLRHNFFPSPVFQGGAAGKQRQAVGFTPAIWLLSWAIQPNNGGPAGKKARPGNFSKATGRKGKIWQRPTVGIENLTECRPEYSAVDTALKREAAPDTIILKWAFVFREKSYTFAIAF